MKIFIFLHYVAFGYLFFTGTMIRSFFPEDSPFRYIIPLLLILYICIDSYIYYKDFLKNGKHKHAKALFIYDCIVFGVTTLTYISFYLINVVVTSIEYGQMETTQIIHISITCVIQLVFLIARGYVHAKIRRTGAKAGNASVS